MLTSSTDVLIVGAGPTGLVLALALAKLGVATRIVDRAATPGTTSRALAVQARTLELYGQLDLAKDVVSRAWRIEAVNFWLAGHREGRMPLGAIGKGMTPYPYVSIFPQDEHEKLLIRRLLAIGVKVERPKELVDLRVDVDRVVATLRNEDGGAETCEARYVAGCDGARSRVRVALHAGFPGGTYEHLFYVADIEAEGAVMDGELHIMLDDAGFLGVFPLAKERRARLVGTISGESLGGREPTWDDVDRKALERAGLHIAHLKWFSTYRVHHRVADHFRQGRAFLLGDAAHIHSPVGGQGMNTGIGDAMNLAWKLAAVLGRRANENLLDTYEAERLAFAKKLVQTTDRLFQSASGTGPVAGILRRRVAPRVFTALSHTRRARAFVFRAVSQTGIEYRASAWSAGRAGRVHGGDRLPWIEPALEGGPDNYEPLRTFDWQAHVYGPPPVGLAERCASARIPLHVLPLGDAGVRAGLSDDHVYLVRPDGHVGAVYPSSHAIERIGHYVESHGIIGKDTVP